MKPKVGVVLSGCGVYDGAEIHESVLTLLSLDRAGAEAVCLAPDVAQRHVVNHLTGQPAEGETRNVLVEAARIARGKVFDLGGFDPSGLDALVLPGGFGAAKNLCDFAFRGADCEVHPEVARVVRAVHAAGKPVGAICIAPTIARWSALVESAWGRELAVRQLVIASYDVRETGVTEDNIDGGVITNGNWFEAAHLGRPL